jgi:hypothetical protein
MENIVTSYILSHQYHQYISFLLFSINLCIANNLDCTNNISSHIIKNNNFSIKPQKILLMIIFLTYAEQKIALIHKHHYNKGQHSHLFNFLLN